MNEMKQKGFDYLSKSLRPLFYLQEQLDKKIMHRFNMELGEEEARNHLLALKATAFRVELAEFLNETRVFKYWSVKPSSPPETLLDEYADGLHFLLSIGIDKGVTSYEIQDIYSRDFTTRDIPFVIEELFMMNWREMNKTEYCMGLELYLQLGTLFGFSWTEISKAYTMKNMENHERQNSAY